MRDGGYLSPVRASVPEVEYDPWAVPDGEQGGGGWQSASMKIDSGIEDPWQMRDVKMCQLGSRPARPAWSLERGGKETARVVQQMSSGCAYADGSVAAGTACEARSGTALSWDWTKPVMEEATMSSSWDWRTCKTEGASMSSSWGWSQSGMEDGNDRTASELTAAHADPSLFTAPDTGGDTDCGVGHGCRQPLRRPTGRANELNGYRYFVVQVFRGDPEERLGFRFEAMPGIGYRLHEVLPGTLGAEFNENSRYEDVVRKGDEFLHLNNKNFNSEAMTELLAPKMGLLAFYVRRRIV